MAAVGFNMWPVDPLMDADSEENEVDWVGRKDKEMCMVYLFIEQIHLKAFIAYFSTALLQLFHAAQLIATSSLCW